MKNSTTEELTDRRAAAKQYGTSIGMFETNPVRKFGELLYGASWQTRLALTLGIARNSVRFWIARGNVPARRLAELRGLVWQSRRNLEAAERMLDQMEEQSNEGI